MTLPPDDPDDREPSGGTLRPTSIGALLGWAAVGVLGGRLLRPLAERVQGTAPVVGWLQPGALLLLAAILGGTAWLTWRTLHVRRDYLDPQRAVNRLVLARSCALVGALVAGGYAGYALAWLPTDTDLAHQRVLRSAVAAGLGVLVVVTALLLERACRVPQEEPD